MQSLQAYVIHLTLAEFLAVPGGIIYAACVTRSSRYGGITTGHATEILAAFRGTEALHAARIIVERSSTMDDAAPVAQGQRATLALATFRAAAERAGRAVAGGLLLVPGLREDAEHYRTAHDLWTWTGDPKDATARELVPAR